MTTPIASGDNGIQAGLSQCRDFMQFENALKNSRAIDDKIIQALNNSIPTASLRSKGEAGEKCQDLWAQISKIHTQREESIKTCVSYFDERMTTLKAAGDRSGARQNQVSLRMLRSELYVEEVIRQRTQTAYHEKCRDFAASTPNSS